MAEEINTVIALKIVLRDSPHTNTPILFAIRGMYQANSFHRWCGPPPPMVEAEKDEARRGYMVGVGALDDPLHRSEGDFGHSSVLTRRGVRTDKKGAPINQITACPFRSKPFSLCFLLSKFCIAPKHTPGAFGLPKICRSEGVVDFCEPTP